jgi:hypothetical protein
MRQVGFRVGVLCFVVVLFAGFNDPALGQFTLLSQSRSTSVTVSEPYPDISSSMSNGVPSSTLAGDFNSSQSQTASGSESAGLPVDATASVTGDGAQSTLISSFYLGGTGSADSSGNMSAGSPFDQATASGTSIFTSVFSVATAQPFSLTGSLGGMDEYHEGPLGVLVGSVQLSDGAGTLYTASESNTTSSFNLGGPLNQPFAFSTTLEPGNIYTLALTASTTSTLNSFAFSDATAANFSFIATVPEPASLTMAMIALPLSMRRRSLR